MKIIELRAENFKRLRAVEIAPDGTLQVIGGRNAQGKSSVLDAIWSALGGGKANPEKPIRDGEQKATVSLDLGDLKITRTWTGKGTTLKVENADGAAYKSPQGMLDSLIGQLGFDPLAFTRLKPREQREELLRLVDLPIDLDDLERQRATVYDQRTEIGRQGKAIGDVTVDDTLPTKETSATDLIAQIEAAQEVARHNSAVELAREQAANKIADLETQIANLNRELVAAKNEYGNLDAEYQALMAPADVDDLRGRLSEVEELNQQIRANNIARERKAEQDRLRTEYEQYTEKIAALDREKADALAKAAFPVDGLGFDDTSVTYQGVPLSQASSAEQIRVSLAMGMALNPKLKVLMIKDGSLLDTDSMTAIREQVAEKGFQVWIERVGDADLGAVVIEDGEIDG